MTALQQRLIGLGAILLLAAAPALLSPFKITLLNFIGIYALAALGVVLLTGIGGMLSFGQAAFVGIAAYATAWASALHGHSPWLGLVLAVVLVCGIAALLASHMPANAQAQGAKGKNCRMEQQCRWENFKKICTWVKVCR